ncbi:N-acylneuraminate-9-phosphatase [Austrofundulus limnaeus]|uniref:N-acylneuraminate-9-phosphatase n=1 Tax=Austrofundulus limnaeus TaxID=52670 RepID=A0A2I4C5P8_AUSLI|nr:PREDICTED: N-acylneuraminate-9-phosphatase [Austrofundulus limnaeus]
MDGRAVKAVFFDLDNTLIETSKAGGAALQKTSELLKTELDLDDASIQTISEKFKQKLLHEQKDGSVGTIDDLRVRHWEESIAETLGRRAPPSLASQCYFLWKNSRLQVLCLSPEVRRLLKRLRGRYKLLLLTNGEAQTQREKLEAVRCEELFHAVVVGGEYPEQKPSPSIFRTCFHLLGVEPQDCVMVGDSLDTDIQGGVSAGVRATVWISGSESDGPVKPDFTVPTVLQLPDILAQLEGQTSL